MTADSQNDKRHKERLRRLDRIFVRPPIYFVTACTFRRRPLLANAALHRSFQDFAGDGAKHGAYVGAYVIMPEHIHLFVALDSEETLSAWMKSLKNSLSKSLRSFAVRSPHWQKGFFDHVLRSGESYSEKWEYVRQNPIRAGLAKSWEQWPYCGEIWPIEYPK